MKQPHNVEIMLIVRLSIYQAQFLFLLEILLRKSPHKMSEDSVKATHI